MTTLADADVIFLLQKVGFPVASFSVMTAIAHAESGFRTDAIGDKDLTEKGECSVGLWQINYRPSRDVTGGPRDPTLNLQPLHNAQAAFMISSSGTRFSPWSTYTNGAYKKYFNEAAAAVQQFLKGTAMPDPDPNVIPAQAPVVALESSPSGHGYWIVCADGEVFAFGDAEYHGRVQGPAKV